MLIIWKGDVGKKVIWYTDGIYICSTVVTINILNDPIISCLEIYFEETQVPKKGAFTTMLFVTVKNWK